ncbi:hypothetical protein BCR33DRAFT_721370 [Rhizoclosmatium globosum]|uniref:Ceramide glucosyltransferase n=1 Tax=Rhizoclosmatium globosum TaxID=329046 RepID=A0A1Y2BSA8_9FUNG|nr:hypothetical protein BCR33DRAFT_721370 [Rhizoclosmatium globosum]|eukprot:ORY37636.1 hypothetical protein BCR33DRAFT_721370 [Rhizoclosmatium globosum]
MVLGTLVQLLPLLIAVAGIGLWVFMFGLGLLSTSICYLRYNQKPSLEQCTLSPQESPGVSILRPLKGADSNLRDNLESTFLLEYPKYEIMFSVAEATDPAIAVVKDLMEQYPNVDAKLIVGDIHVGVNPKVNNMVKSYDASKYEIVWIVDSNVTVTPHTLTRAIYHLLQPNVGLIHHLPIGVLPESLGASVEQVYLNTSHVKMYTIISMLISCVIGKSNMFRKSELDAVGGLAHFAKFMSEDNLIGRTIWNKGRRHVVPGDVVYQSLGGDGVKKFFLRKAHLDGVIVEPFIECLVNGLLGAYGFKYFLGTPMLQFYCAHVLYWFCLDMVLTSVNFPHFWLDGFRVDWRGVPYRLQPGGTVIPESDYVGFTKSIRAAIKTLQETISFNDLSWTSQVYLFGFTGLAALFFALAYVAECFVEMVLGPAEQAAPVRFYAFETKPGETGNEIGVDAGAERRRVDSGVKLDDANKVILVARQPIWVRAACYMGGCHFVSTPSVAKAWGNMIEGIAKKAGTLESPAKEKEN